ncbi:YCF48-related protein [Pseudomonas sp. GV071]|uniref:WD40/YVTN/BNR-like repeat-containing protein n=1 Tax=Pseudomonas sp. GV071 TaxID=2135754 RepID=UPI000D3C1E87|nr:YCF48-related protein [Pseudomonas sp. GV071]PTQ66795.1 photosystem II stability/assembly factor-like uncharacterized protein [Pseudomonas sp. GV071]
MSKNRKALALLLLAMASASAGAVAPLDVLSLPAVQGVQAQHAVLLGITRAGERLVAVGERGIVLLSDDNGATWHQASVPVSSTLTAVQFVDSKQGWAVGHAGVVLHSADGGDSWSLQLDGKRAAAVELAAAQAAADAPRQANAERLVADGADKPLLALSFANAREGLVVGAYGLALHTDDGGATWTSWMDRLPNPRGLHLYAVAQQGQQLYLAGEQGLLLGSQDNGGQFNTLTSPYEGSYFSLALEPAGGLVVAGLRGNLFRSVDQGASFQTLSNPIPISINAAVVIDRQLLLVNQAGGLLQGAVGGETLRPVALPPGAPLLAVAQAVDGALVGVGFAGPQRLAAAHTSIAE